MPKSTVAAFSEPDDFGLALRPEGLVDFSIAGSGRFRAQLTQVTLNRMALCSGEERTPRIAFVSVPADSVLLFFAPGKAPGLKYGGREALAGEVLFLASHEECFARTEGPARWCAIRLPFAQLVGSTMALTGSADCISAGVQRYRPLSKAYRHLRSLHAAVVRIAGKSPQALADAEAAHGLEQQLLHAVVVCLLEGPAVRATQSAVRDRQIMAAFQRLLERRPGEAISADELCCALHISQASLRRLCAEHLGMTATAYCRLRRGSETNICAAPARNRNV